VLANDIPVVKYSESFPRDVCVVLLLFYLGEWRGSEMRSGGSVWEERGHCMPKQLPSSSRDLPILHIDRDKERSERK